MLLMKMMMALKKMTVKLMGKGGRGVIDLHCWPYSRCCGPITRQEYCGYQRTAKEISLVMDDELDVKQQKTVVVPRLSQLETMMNHVVCSLVMLGNDIDKWISTNARADMEEGTDGVAEPKLPGGQRSKDKQSRNSWRVGYGGIMVGGVMRTLDDGNMSYTNWSVRTALARSNSI